MSLPSARSTTFLRRGRHGVVPLRQLRPRHGTDHRSGGPDFKGLCFVNLVDFDAQWGHRRNPEGYGHEIEKFDKNLGVLMEKLGEDDLLLLRRTTAMTPRSTAPITPESMCPCWPGPRPWTGAACWSSRTALPSSAPPLPTTSVWPCLRAPSAPRFSASWVNRPIARRRRDDPWATKPSTRPCPSSKGWTRTGRPSSGVFQNRAPVADGVVPD